MSDHKHEHSHTHEHSHDHTHEHDHSIKCPHNHEHDHEHAHDYQQGDSHEHSHGHDHSHDHSHGDVEKQNTPQIISLLKYMLQHNQQHTEELLSMASKLEKEGFTESAEIIKESVLSYRQGNEKLAQALSKTE